MKITAGEKQFILERRKAVASIGYDDLRDDCMQFLDDFDGNDFDRDISEIQDNMATIAKDKKDKKLKTFAKKLIIAQENFMSLVEDIKDYADYVDNKND